MPCLPMVHSVLETKSQSSDHTPCAWVLHTSAAIPVYETGRHIHIYRGAGTVACTNSHSPPPFLKAAFPFHAGARKYQTTFPQSLGLLEKYTTTTTTPNKKGETRRQGPSLACFELCMWSTHECLRGCHHPVTRSY